MSLNPLLNFPSSLLLRVTNLSVHFSGLVAIESVSFDVLRGTITALIGPNGAGKTTLFNCLTGFYKPTHGQIEFWLEEPSSALSSSFRLDQLPEHKISQQARVARTFQNIRLFSGMSVLENLLVAQHKRLMQASHFSLSGLLQTSSYRFHEKQAVEKAKYWLERCGLIARADEPAGALPYGAQRQLEIIRAMCTEPLFLCLDEPAAGLNPAESAALKELIQDLRTQHGVTLLLIEHDMSVVMEIADHIIVLDHGTKIAEGPPHLIRQDPHVIAAYLGVEDSEEPLVLQTLSSPSNDIPPYA